MADNFNMVMSVVGMLMLITIIHNPIIVYAGEGVPNVALFAFGDSYYDAGNKKFVTGGDPPQNKWPYGKSRDDPNGKFSDGHIVPDFIGEFISIPNGIPPAYNPTSDFSRGASFAVDGASLSDFHSAGKYSTLSKQVEAFKAMKNKWNETYIKQSLFMIYIGTEDYLKFIQRDPNPDTSKQQAYVESITTQLKKDIKSLTTLGARKFVVQSLAPLGCLPIVKQDFNTLTECFEILNDLAKQHNAKIGPMLNEFANSSDIDGFQFSVFDFYNVIQRRIEIALRFRFYVADKSCCGVGPLNAYGCGKGNVHSKLCEYQRSYLFFDGRHNTEKAQEEFAHLLYGANLNVIRPMNIRELIVYPTGEKMREFWEPDTVSSGRRTTKDDSYISVAEY